MHPYLQPLLGGILIGLASWLLLASLGRVTGISGIASTAIAPADNTAQSETAWRWAYIVGLVVAGTVVSQWIPAPSISTRPLPLLIAAGLLVGVGTVLGSGCTSGHGVCGLGRRSLRSLVATCVFMASGIATVSLSAFLRGA
jgi:uncharacterized protein